MSAPDEAQKMLCIIASLEFFSCVSTRRLLFHHNCPVRSQRLCVKGRFLCSTFLTRNLNGLVSRRYQGALPPVLENFRRAFFLDPTDWPWVSEDELRLIRSGSCSVYYPCSSLCSLCLERTVWIIDCKTVRIFAYSSTREQSSKRSGMMLKTESETGERRFARVRLLRHAIPISLLSLRKNPTVLQSMWITILYIVI